MILVAILIFWQSPSFGQHESTPSIDIQYNFLPDSSIYFSIMHNGIDSMVIHNAEDEPYTTLSEWNAATMFVSVEEQPEKVVFTPKHRDQDNRLFYFFFYKEGRTICVLEKIISREDAQQRDSISDDFALFQNYPNPFNPTTTISFNLQASGNIRLLVFNVRGQIIVTLIDDELGVGNHQVELNATRFPSGIYIYKLETAQGTRVKKMSLIR